MSEIRSKIPRSVTEKILSIQVAGLLTAGQLWIWQDLSSKNMDAREGIYTPSTEAALEV